MRQLTLLGFFALLGGLSMTNSTTEKPEAHLGRYFVAFTDLKAFAQTELRDDKKRLYHSEEITSKVSANEIVVSWNMDTKPEAGVAIEIRAKIGERWTKYYHLGHWSQSGNGFPRESVKGQKDADGDVATDTLVLKQHTTTVQLRLTVRHSDSSLPQQLRFVGVSFTDTAMRPAPLPSNKNAWGKEIKVPEKWQTGWEGAKGWCSPTSTSMMLAFWGQRLKRPEMDIPVPEAARACYDPIYEGTGNWTFNTAFAGSFPQMRAYVTRLGGIHELEDWIEAGFPVVVSGSLDILRNKARAYDPGHLLVLTGFTAEGDVVMNDPAYSPERGEVARRIYSRSNFLRSWAKSKNTVYLIYPEGTALPPAHHEHWETSSPSH
jgi:hypothetical protein